MKPTPVTIWDIPTRLIHWGLAACIVLNLWITEEGEDWHEWIGYLAASLVGFRFIVGFGGFSGAPASRFSNFPLGVADLKAFISDSLSGNPASSDGHNPLASLTYICVWILVIAMAVTGWMMSLDAFWGEEWLEDTHEALSNGFLLFMVLHASGMIIDAVQHKRSTWMGMITGKRD